MNQSDIQSLHDLYCRETGFRLTMRYDRERAWYEYTKAGFSADDLHLVLVFLKTGIRKQERRSGCIKFSNMIENLPGFEEELCLARAHVRNNRPRTNREAALETLRPVVKESCTTGVAKPANEVLLKLAEELRKAAR